ncbi:DUF4132 domain-containing protein [Streptomyces sp. NPDC050738]|uniref:DUF4132 domain-containing protein n=1 Tax=Streptomyces sp. NPDC050738 TaxID=3154744 RepID=UPI00341F0C31
MTTVGGDLDAALDAAWAKGRVRGTERPLHTLIESLDAGGRRRAGLWLHRNLRAHEGDGVTSGALAWLARQRLDWTPPEAAELLRRAADYDDSSSLPFLFRHFLAQVELPLAAVEQSGVPGDAGLLRMLREASLKAWGPESRLSVVRSRLDALLTAARTTAHATADGTGLPLTILDELDAYGPAMRSAHRDLLASEGIADFLVHCATQDKVRATQRWRKKARPLLAGAARGTEALRTLLEGVAAQEEHSVSGLSGFWGTSWWSITSDANAQLVRGLLWAAADLKGDWVVPLLGDVALNAGTGLGGQGGQSRSGKIATTAVAVLGTFDGVQGEQAAQRLGTLRDKLRNRTVLKGISASLESVAERSGVTPGMLRERAVPDCDIDARGVREVPFGAYTGVLSVHAPGMATLGFHGPEGRVLKSAPKAVKEEHGPQLTALKRELKQVRALLTGERTRLEEQLTADTRWSAHDWQSYSMDHPVTGTLARGLIWEVRRTDGGTWSAGLPERADGGWGLVATDGASVPVTDGDRLRLWHPMRADAEDVRAWREEITRRELRQPFKQAFREIYPLTPAEVGTLEYSNRFAGHILRYGQARALMAERGWSGGHLGYYSDGGSAEMVRELPEPGHLPSKESEFWRASFFIELAGGREDGLATLCATDQVRFERRHGPRGPWEPAELTGVPPLLLSEAMRDVDLFVGVTSIGADPEWQDRGTGRGYGRYWESWSFGELTESARIRKETLARLLPRTRIADRVELTDRFLRVRGELRTYRIHLGSGNILMEPDDAYLCIVTHRGPAAGDRLFLPFEEDGGLLSVILSKAFLLAGDDRITDRTITAQLRR